MASISRSRPALEAGSGGKIVRTRRAARVRTPYDRPTFTNPPPENPNWLSRFLYSPTRSIVSNAGKVLSSVFRSDSSSSSEDGSDDDEDDGDYVSSQEDDGLKKRNGTSETVFRQGETKHAIEQLLRQETFSREECDKLIKIIKSRVVGCTTIEDAENTRPNIDTPDLSAAAVSEAKKWLMEKRLGSASKSDLDYGTMSSVLFPQGDEDDGGSPADVAKSYMRARPPWASPSIQHGELKSASPLGMQLFNEESKYSIGGNSVSTSKLKRDSPATGSWNIQEEIRRVRTKATEEMLRSIPSTRIDWSAFSLENRSTLNSLPDGKQEADMGSKLRKASGSTMNSSLGITTTHGFEVLEKTQDGLQIEASPLPAIISSERNQDLDAASIVGKRGSQNALEEILSSGKRLQASADIKTALGDAGSGDFDGHMDTSGTEQPNAVAGGTIQYSKLDDQTCSTTGKEVTGSRSAYTTNGFPSSAPSVSAQLGTGETTVLNGKINQVSSSHEKIVANLLVEEETYELQKEMSRVPNVNENENDIDDTKDNDSAASGSQNSSSMPDELSQELTQPQPKLKSTAPAKDSSIVEKPKATRLTRYNRRGRQRGK
ncbi:hypothetical protein M0R45_012222 [Rubus argutus]|uniref:Protein KAKU4 n=1 Tax=Rubus argutus TaxID=59490 RepID=A0AAW1YDH8_RUBAR